MTLTQAELAERMKELDTCLLCTRTGDGMDARPMSNNQDVAWDGTSWFFTDREAAMVPQLEADPAVMVTYAAKGLWVSVHGTAVLHEDKELMREHWDPDIDRWFSEGVDTPGLVLIEVASTTIRYWSFEDGDGTIEV